MSTSQKTPHLSWSRTKAWLETINCAFCSPRGSAHYNRDERGVYVYHPSILPLEKTASPLINASAMQTMTARRTECWFLFPADRSAPCWETWSGERGVFHESAEQFPMLQPVNDLHSRLRKYRQWRNCAHILQYTICNLIQMMVQNSTIVAEDSWLKYHLIGAPRRSGEPITSYKSIINLVRKLYGYSWTFIVAEDIVKVMISKNISSWTIWRT